MSLTAPPPASVFRHPAFRLFWAARFASALAVQAQSIAIGWQVYSVARLTEDVRHSAFMVGMVGLVQFLPMFSLSLFAGSVVDRGDRRTIMATCACFDIASTIGLAWLALHPAPSLVPLFLLAAAFGATRAFIQPSSAALGPMLVPREELPRAIAWNAMSFQIASILGPFVGGVLVAISAWVAYATAGVLYAVAVGLLLCIRAHTRAAPQPGSRMAQIREGLAYVWTNKIVLGAISLDLFAVLLGGATALLPVFARDILQVGATGFGALRAGPSIGAMLMSFYLSRRPIRRRAGILMFTAVGVFGLATIGFAESRWLPLSVLLLAVLGAGDMISVYVRQSLVQILTPDHMRGRVSAVSYLFIGASNELGAFETGVVARLLGPVGACLFGGVGSLVVTGLWARMFPSLRKADELVKPGG